MTTIEFLVLTALLESSEVHCKIYLARAIWNVNLFNLSNMRLFKIFRCILKNN